MPSLSRRRLMLASASLGIHASLRAQGALFDTQVAIVGAGAAGLAAARECQRLKLDFVMLEARGRIGGRMHTDHSLGDGFDAGASYIHWAERNPWADIARENQVATITDAGGRGAFQLYEKGMPVERSPARRAAFDRLSELLDGDAATVPDISLTEQTAAAGADVERAVGTMARMSLGEEPERVSAKDYARLWGGEDFLVPSGYGNLAVRYGADMPVRLGVAVSHIDVSGPGVGLGTAQGSLRARYCVVTVPVGVLRAGSITFLPALPSATQEAIAGLGMGNLAKIALKFDGSRFGFPDGADLLDIEGPREMFDFECWAFGRNLVVAYLGGDHARAVLAQGQAGAIASTLEVFCRVAGADARKAFVDGAVANWQAEPYSRGAYSHALPGHASARTALAQPVAEKLWFAGEATGGEGHGGAMTAGGAFLAGRDAVRAIAALGDKR